MMTFSPCRIPDVVMIEPRVIEDERGSFLETWTREAFAAGGIDADFVQDNHSVSRQWVLRGLHYQLHRPQGKLVRLVQGEAFDVAVDLRRRSRTFGQWVAMHLSAGNRRMLWIPPGFAHGFLAVSESAEVVYKCTDYYDPADEHALRWDDADLAIEWPLPRGASPRLSARDAAAGGFSDAACFG